MQRKPSRERKTTDFKIPPEYRHEILNNMPKQSCRSSLPRSESIITSIPSSILLILYGFTVLLDLMFLCLTSFSSSTGPRPWGQELGKWVQGGLISIIVSHHLCTVVFPVNFSVWFGGLPGGVGNSPSI